MQNDKDFEKALKSAYEERIVPPTELSEKVLMAAANRISVRQSRIVSFLSIAISVFFAVLTRIFAGATPIFYIAGINAVAMIIGVVALMTLYPILIKSPQGV